MARCRPISLVGLLAAALMLGACGDEEARHGASAPAPAEITRDDIGHYCNMIVADHAGPKGQIHIEGRQEPVWFSSVRDTIVFTLLPEEPRNIAAIYVNDMGRASWDSPGAGTWIDARRAWYVLESDRRGGMGAPEAVPFAEKADAEIFVSRHGGRIVAFDAVPRDYVLSDASEPPRAAEHQGDTAMPTGSRSGMLTDNQHGHGHDKQAVQ